MNFPNLIDHIIIGNFMGDSGVRLSKQDMLKQIHADVLLTTTMDTFTMCPFSYEPNA